MKVSSIKLIKLNSLPNTKIINDFRNGIQYKSLGEDCKRLESNLKGMGKVLSRIQQIDNFNGQHKLISSDDIVIFKLRSTHYEADISKYVQPLNMINVWDDDKRYTLKNIWKKLYGTNELSNFNISLNSDNSWIYDGNLSNFLITQGQYEFLFADFERWLRNRHYNFHPLINAVDTFKKYNAIDFSATAKLLTNDRNIYAETYNSQIESFDEIVESINYKRNIYIKLNKGISLDKIVPPFNFYALYGEKDMGARFLTDLHNISLEIPGAISWIKNNGDIYSGNEIAKMLLKHEKILDHGHSGATLTWTVKTLKYVYNKGWECFVSEYLSLEI